MTVTLHEGDMRAVLPTLEARFHAVVTDPPYHLASIVKRFGAEGAAPAKSNGTTGAYERSSRGFMGKQWDGGQIAFEPETWAAVGAVMLPGAHLVAFGGTKGFHRMACAIEDAGFEIRDTLAWLYGTGFPKSQNVSKAIDKGAGESGTFGDPKSAAHAGWIDRGAMRGGNGHEGLQRPWMDDAAAVDRAAREYIPATDLARAWQGWGTALKPAFEPIILARWPMIGTVAANLEAHGCGALNIEACRIEHAGDSDLAASKAKNPGRVDKVSSDVYGAGRPQQSVNIAGRWPANVVHDGSEEVLAAFPNSSGGSGSTAGTGASQIYGAFNHQSRRGTPIGFSDSGSAARFFYSAKADSDDRLGSKHPTVKPVDLMRWLVRLVTPKGGLVLDPFAGSGSTGMACMAEGFDCHLIEREAEYAADIRRRIAHVAGMDTPLFAV